MTASPTQHPRQDPTSTQRPITTAARRTAAPTAADMATNPPFRAFPPSATPTPMGVGPRRQCPRPSRCPLSHPTPAATAHACRTHGTHPTPPTEMAVASAPSANGPPAATTRCRTPPTSATNTTSPRTSRTPTSADAPTRPPPRQLGTHVAHCPQALDIPPRQGKTTATRP